MTNEQTTGERIILERRRLGLSQTKLADALGTSRHTLIDLEADRWPAEIIDEDKAIQKIRQVA